MSLRDIHTPVLLERCIELLAPALTADGAVLVDATLGMGGHSEAFLERFPNIRLILGNVIRDAGYPPLVLEPIDFVGLYEQQSQDPNFGAAMPPAEGNA